MPTAPPAVFAAPTLAPAAIGAVHAAPSSPAAAGAVFAAPSLAPLFVPLVVADVGRGLIQVAGTLSPDASGILMAVAAPAAGVYPGGKEYTSTGLSGHPAAGRQVRLYQSYLVTPAQTTLALLAPVAGYTAGEVDTASGITITDSAFASVKSYYLHENGGSPQWQEVGGDASSKGALVIGAGALVFPYLSPGIGFIGGLGATWQASPTAAYLWALTVAIDDEIASGSFTGIGTTPATASWTPRSTATGTPTAAALASATAVAPPAVFAAPAASPATPPAIFTP